MASSTFFLALSATWFLWGVRKPTWDPFSPGRLYGAIWFSAIGITTLYWSGLQTRWSTSAWFWILSSVGAFEFGSVAAGSLQHLRRNESRRHGFVDGKATVQRLENSSQRRLLVLLALMSGICFTAFYLRVEQIGSIPLFSDSPEMARWEFYNRQSSFTEKTLTHLSFASASVMIIAMLCGVLAKRLRRTEKLILIFFWMAALCVLLATAFRGALVCPLLVSTAIYHYLRKKLNVRAIAVVAMAGLVLGIAVPWYRHMTSPGFGDVYTYQLAKMDISAEYSGLSHVYIVIALSLDNMVSLLNQPMRWTGGLLTLRPLLTITGLKTPLLENVQLPFEWGYSFNTSTYLLPFYHDFGPLGFIVPPFLFGFICKAVYRHMLETGSVLHVAVYGFIVFLIVFSVLDNLFVFMKFWIELGLVCVVVWFTVPRNKATMTSAQAAK